VQPRDAREPLLREAGRLGGTQPPHVLGEALQVSGELRLVGVHRAHRCTLSAARAKSDRCPSASLMTDRRPSASLMTGRRLSVRIDGALQSIRTYVRTKRPARGLSCAEAVPLPVLGRAVRGRCVPRSPRAGAPDPKKHGKAQMTTVREATFDLFRQRGMTTIFGNPGSTELPMLGPLPDDFRYVLGLQEAVAVGMADGFAQASGNVAHVNLHTAPGVGNGVGAIFGARANKAPL